MSENPTFWELFRGDVTNAEFAFSFFLVGLGILLYTLVRIYNRTDQTSKVTFQRWISYKNNKLEMIISILFLYPQVRFAEVYDDWLMALLPDTFKAVPFFIMLATGYLQHYILVRIFKATK